MTVLALVHSFGVAVILPSVGAALATFQQPREARVPSLLGCLGDLAPTLVVGLCALASAILYLRTPYSIMRFRSDMAIDVTVLAQGMRFALPAVGLWWVYAGEVLSATRLLEVTRSWDESLVGLSLLQATVVASDRGAVDFFGRRLFTYRHLLVAVSIVMIAALVRHAARRHLVLLDWLPDSLGRVPAILATVTLVVALASGCVSYCLGQIRDDNRSAIYQREYGTMAEGWTWVSTHISDSRIAYSGLNQTYPFYDAALSNRLRYVNVTGELDWRYHDFTYLGRYYREEAAQYEEWLHNLHAWSADYVILSRSLELVEAEWVMQHLDVFNEVYACDDLAVYRVLGTH